MTAFRKGRHGAARQNRMVRKQMSPDLPDPGQEWRRLFAQTWGTFLLVHAIRNGQPMHIEST